ncbi:MAG: histidine phosphatase family protein [Candidatus Omnitrophota bacterium]
MAVKLLLIRHGQTNYNLKKRYSGFADVGLNKTGKQQARGLVKKLEKEKIHKIYASDRKRAIQTAKILFKNREIEKISDLREIHFGVFEGLTYKEILQKYPVIYKRWLKNPYKITVPKGESLSDLKKRVIRAIKKIMNSAKGGSASGGKTVAIVTHGGVISVFLNHLLKTRDFWNTIPKSASLSIVEHKNKKIKINLFNDVSHLIPPLAGYR